MYTVGQNISQPVIAKKRSVHLFPPLHPINVNALLSDSIVLLSPGDRFHRLVQPPLLLFVGAEHHDRQLCQRVDRQVPAGSRIDSRDLLGDDHQVDVAHAGTIGGFGHVAERHPHLGGGFVGGLYRPERVHGFVGSVGLWHQRFQFRPREFAGTPSELLLFFGQCEIDHPVRTVRGSRHHSTGVYAFVRRRSSGGVRNERGGFVQRGA